MTSDASISTSAAVPTVVRPGSPWATVAVIIAATSAFVLNGHVTGVALPAIAQDLGTASAFDIDWVVTSFLVGVVAVQPVTGWLSDRMGRRLVLVWSLALFGVGAVICLLSPTLTVLLVGRLVQGFGGGALMPVGKAVIYDLFAPDRRGQALSTWALAVMVAPAAGPPLGGWVVTQADWRWVFAAFAVVAAAAAMLCSRRIPEVGYRDERPLDGVGWTIAVAAVVVVVLGARHVPVWGPTSPATLTCAVLGVVLVTAFVIRSRRRQAPLVDFTMFHSATFSVAMFVVTILAVSQYARINYLPIELQVVRGLDAQTVGVLLAPAAIGIAVVLPLGGWIVDRLGAKLPTTIGMLMIAAGMWQLGHLRADGSELPVVLALLTQGVGTGFATIPTTVAAMNSLPRRFVAPASAVESLNRQLAGAISIAVLGAVVATDLGAIAPVAVDPVAAQDAYNGVFLIAFWISVLGAVAALFLPGPRRSREDHRLRSAEFI